VRFWDTSGIIPLCVEEPMSSVARQLAEIDNAVAVWWGTPVECWSAFARLRRDGVLTEAEEDLTRQLVSKLGSAWLEILPGDEVKNIAGRLLMTHPLRAADAMQLAAALIWSDKTPRGHEFVCLDLRLREAARREGFLVLPIVELAS